MEGAPAPASACPPSRMAGRSSVQEKERRRIRHHRRGTTGATLVGAGDLMSDTGPKVQAAVFDRAEFFLSRTLQICT